jgi:glycogenin glucosyltransferase
VLITLNGLCSLRFAPAYERYGKGIMTAHFIGQHKPWNRVKPSRPSSTSSGSGTAPADYDSLLLRWHEAYEEYYPGISAKQLGSANVIHTERGVEVVERPFTVPTYTAVWDAESDLMLSGSDLSSSSSNRRGSNRVRGVRSKSSVSSLLRGAGQAEDLRGMFQGNVVDASVAAEVAAFTKDASRGPNEGIYISLPLDGRTSLMGVEMDSGAEDSPDSDQTIDAGKYHSSQYTQTQSHDSQGQQGSGQWSPPKMSWDPAKEPPPMGVGSSGYQMRIPVDAFYINAWDQASQPKGKAAFFDTSTRPSTEPHTLARLQREHYFDNLGSDRPDPSLVKAVFPWEAKQSQTSSRIFPDEPNSVIPGSRGLDASLEAGSASSGETSSETSNTGQTLSPSSFGTPTTYQTFSPPASSHKGLPPTLSYTNAWDQMGVGSRNEGRSRSGSNKAAQALTGDSRSSRSTQTPNAIKNRNRGGGQTEGGGTGSGSWEGQHHSHRQFSSGGGSSGSGMGQGVRDASADQSADGDNESSSSSSDEDDGTSDGATGTKWRRKGPGPGYQRKAERHSGQFGGGGPRSPRGGQPMLASGVGGGGNSKAGGGGGEAGVGIGATSMTMNRSRSSSSSSNTPHAFILPIGGSSMANRQRSRTEDALPYIEDEETMPPPSLDMSLSTAYQGSTYNQLSFPSFPQTSASTHLQWLSRNSPTSSLPNSAQNSGSNSPTGTYTPFSQSPVASRSDLRQMARTHSQLQRNTTSRTNRRLLD